MKYTLSNSTLKISVNSLGAELQSLFYLPNELEFLWQGDTQFWARQAPILFPIVGKLHNDELKHNNKVHTMSQHGFARDCEFELIAQKPHSISFRLLGNNDTKAKYPFNFELTVTFTLNEQTLTTTYCVHNLSNEVLPFSIGGHPAFNWPLMPTIQKSDHQISFNKVESTKISQLSLGLIAESKIKNPTTDKSLKLKKNLFENDALIFKNIKSDIVKFIGTSALNTAFVEMSFSDFNDFGIWSKPEADFVCIEPWLGYSSPESFKGDITDKPGILQLSVGEKVSYSFDIKVGIS